MPYEPIKGGELERVFDPLGVLLRNYREAETPEARRVAAKTLVDLLQARFRQAEDLEGTIRKERAVELEGQMGLLGPAASLTRRYNSLERLGRWTLEEALALSGLDGYDMTFEGFKTASPSLKRAKAVAEKFSLERDPPFLTLVGKPGVGKSHLAVAIGRALCQSNPAGFVLYRPEREFLAELRHAVEGGPDPMYDFEACDLLILDDLGVESATAWAKARLDSLIDSRYMGRRLTVVCTNAAPDEISPRIASRLRDTSVGRTVFIDAPDYRTLKREPPSFDGRG